MNKEWVVDVNVPPQELEARLNGREGYLLYAIYYDGDATFTLVWRTPSSSWRPHDGDSWQGKRDSDKASKGQSAIWSQPKRDK